MYVERFPIPSSKSHTLLVPNRDIEELYLPLSVFDFSSTAKNGCGEL